MLKEFLYYTFTGMIIAFTGMIIVLTTGIFSLSMLYMTVNFPWLFVPLFILFLCWSLGKYCFTDQT